MEALANMIFLKLVLQSSVYCKQCAKYVTAQKGHSQNRSMYLSGHI